MGQRFYRLSCTYPKRICSFEDLAMVRRSKKNRGVKDVVTPSRVSPMELIVKRIPGFAQKSYRTVLTYNDDFTLNCGAGTAGSYVFSANGLYDPNITGTGHQPMAFDQLMLSFEHYTVFSSKITATVRSSDVDDSQWCAISLNAGTTAVTDHNVIMENGMVVAQKMGLAASQYAMRTLTHRVDVRTFESVPSVLSNPDLQGSITANPVEQVYYHCSTWNPETANVTGSYWSVFIEYDVLFTEPRKNSASLSKQIHSLIIEEVKRENKPEEKESIRMAEGPGMESDFVCCSHCPHLPPVAVSLKKALT